MSAHSPHIATSMTNLATDPGRNSYAFQPACRWLYPRTGSSRKWIRVRLHRLLIASPTDAGRSDTAPEPNNHATRTRTFRASGRGGSAGWLPHRCSVPSLLIRCGPSSWLVAASKTNLV